MKINKSYTTTRCPWAANDSLLQNYHDHRWCKPVHDEHELFALLILEGFSVGLSWKLILQKETLIRENCNDLKPESCARYDEKKEKQLMELPGMIHHQGKIRSIGINARAFLNIQTEFGSFDRFIWQYTERKTIDHKASDMSLVPTRTPLSEQISKDLKKRGFQYLGPTILYSYMQSIGMVNDHLTSCPFR